MPLKSSEYPSLDIPTYINYIIIIIFNIMRVVIIRPFVQGKTCVSVYTRRIWPYKPSESMYKG